MLTEEFYPERKITTPCLISLSSCVARKWCQRQTSSDLRVMDRRRPSLVLIFFNKIVNSDGPCCLSYIYRIFTIFYDPVSLVDNVSEGMWGVFCHQHITGPGRSREPVAQTLGQRLRYRKAQVPNEVDEEPYVEEDDATWLVLIPRVSTILLWLMWTEEDDEWHQKASALVLWQRYWPNSTVVSCELHAIVRLTQECNYIWVWSFKFGTLSQKCLQHLAC